MKVNGLNVLFRWCISLRGGGEEGTKGKRDDIFAGVGKTTAIRPAMGEIR